MVAAVVSAAASAAADDDDNDDDEGLNNRNTKHRALILHKQSNFDVITEREKKNKVMNTAVDHRLLLNNFFFSFIY